MTVMDSVKAKLDEYEYLLKLQMEKIEELVAENERLKAAGGAHAVLKSIYLDSNQPESLRAKAATAAIVHETPKLMPERAPLDLQATEAEVIPLKQLVEMRKARADRFWDPLKLNGNGNDEPSGTDPGRDIDATYEK